MAKRRLTDQQKRRIASNQNQLLTEADLKNALDGTIISHHGRQLVVEDASGNPHKCKLRQNLGDIACGDKVKYLYDSETQQGVVIAINTRTNALEKTGFGGKAKIVAANIDQIFIVCAIEPEPNTYLLDRYIVAAENLPAEAVIVLNKIDIENENSQSIVNKIKSTYENIGYKVLITSAIQSTGVSELETALKDKTSILVGLSGVGKSTLVNSLIPDINIRVGELSVASNEGKHTTTVSSLYDLPHGGKIIDSPGVRDFTPHNKSADEIFYGFTELRPYKGLCKFSNCTHKHEPDCAIIDALENGKLNKQRVDSFQHMLEDIQE